MHGCRKWKKIPEATDFILASPPSQQMILMNESHSAKQRIHVAEDIAKALRPAGTANISNISRRLATSYHKIPSSHNHHITSTSFCPLSPPSRKNNLIPKLIREPAAKILQTPSLRSAYLCKPALELDDPIFIGHGLKILPRRHATHL
jgi:hypothetical protein